MAYGRLLEGQQTKVRKLTEAYEKAKAEQGEHADKTQRLAEQLNRATAEMTRTERELSEVTSELERQERQLAQSQNMWNKLSESTKRFSDGLKSVGSKISSVGKDISMRLSAPIVAMGAGIVKTAADFEAQMDRVGAIAGATGNEINKLSETAMHLGATTSKSAKEVAVGMENMAAMGFEVNEIMAAMPGIISAAEASGADMAQTADVVAAALNAFKLQASEASRVADVLAQTANQSAADITDLQYAFKYAAPVAKALDISMEQLAASVGIMADSGMRGEQAGTTLRSALLRLTDPPKAAANTLEDLGVSITDAKGKMLPFSNIIGQLSKATEDMTNVQKAAALSTIFGTEAVSGMLSVIEAGPEKLDELTKGLENSAGASKKAADQMKDNLKGAMEELGGAIETMSIQLGNILIPIVRDVVTKFQGLVEKFTELSPSTQKVILAIGGIAAALGPLLVIGGTLITSLGAIVGAFSTVAGAIGVVTTGAAAATPAIGALASVFTALTGPIGIAVAAIVGIGVGAALVVKELKKSSIEIDDWSKDVSKATAKAVGGFVKISDDVGQSLSQLHLTSATITSEIATEMTGKFDSMYSQIVEGANTKHNEQMDSLRNYFLNSSALTDEEEKKILEKQQQSHENEMAILESKNQIVADIMKKAAEEKRELTDHERQVIDNINLQMKEDAVRVLSESEAEQKVILEKMRASADELTAQQAADVVKNAVKQKDEVVAEAEKTYEEAIAHITRMRDETGAITTEQADKMIAEAKKSRDTTIKYAEEMHDEIIAKAQSQASEHVNQVNWETGEIKSKWQVMKDDVSKKMKQLGSDIKRDWTQAYQDVKKSVADIYNSAVNKFDEMKTSITNKMTEVKVKIETKWNEAQSFLANISLIQIGKDIVQGLIDGIGDMFGNVKKKVENLASLIPEWAKKVLGIHSPSYHVVTLTFGLNDDELVITKETSDRKIKEHVKKAFPFVNIFKEKLILRGV